MEAAIGNSDFKDVRDVGAYFVDKSELIDRILRMRGVKALLFTRPRRFGKSLNLSMIDAYLNLKYKGNTWFDGLKISDLRPDDPMKNASPVIRLDMKDFEAATAEETVTVARTDMSAAFRRYRELEDSDKLSSHQIKLYGRYCDMDVGKADVMISLQQLSEMLEAHYGRKAVILIDEYDAPINNAYGNPELREITDFFRRFLSSALKGNDYLDRAVLTGVMQLSKESIFSGLNNLYVDNILSTGFDDTVGFTEAEVKKMCADFGAPDRFAEAKEWYDGYRFGNTDVYNPWSVLNYVSRRFVPDRYWAGTSKNGIIDTLIAKTDRKTYEDIMKLGSGGMAAEDLSMSVTFDDLSPDHGGSSIYSVMAASGYLRAEKVPSGGYRLSIPNKEMRSVYAEKFLNALGKLEIEHGPVYGFCQAVLANDSAAMEDCLREMMERGARLPDDGGGHAHEPGRHLQGGGRPRIRGRVFRYTHHQLLSGASERDHRDQAHGRHRAGGRCRPEGARPDKRQKVLRRTEGRGPNIRCRLRREGREGPRRACGRPLGAQAAGIRAGRGARTAAVSLLRAL